MPTNVVLYSVGIAIAAVGLLGWVVYLNNRHSSTNRTFFYFSLVSIFWNLSNFFVNKVTDSSLGLLFVRLNIFFAVWYSFLLFRLFYVFPSETADLSPKTKKLLTPFIAAVSVLTLTPLVLGKVISFDQQGHIAKISNGPAIPIFGITTISLISLAVFFLLRKTRRATGNSRVQLQFVGAGAVITFTLHIIFNLIFPALLQNSQYISLGALFTFPFIFFTSYAILRHNLLNVKVLTTEITSFLVLALTFIEIIVSKTTLEIVLRSVLFAVLLLFSFILIRSVRREVEQRVELASVNNKLGLANEHLKELDQAKSEFVSIASHQLRTPMTGIMGYLSMMTQGDFGKIKPEHQKILVDLLAESQRMIRLINQFLNVSKIEAGRFSYNKAPVQLEELIEREIKETQKAAVDKGLKIIPKLPSRPLPKAVADADKLQDVILNLIDNAIKYTDKGTLTVGAEQLGDQLHFFVKDTGIGIKHEDTPELFNKFVRGSGIAQIHPDGSGLGLFIAKSIIDAHGGRIWADSEGEGQGSTFQFTIPINSPVGPAPTSGRDAAAHIVKPQST